MGVSRRNYHVHFLYDYLNSSLLSFHQLPKKEYNKKRREDFSSLLFIYYINDLLIVAVTS
jgi:hypothetical protein